MLLRTRILEFPSYHTIPLVELQRKVSVALNPLGIV